MLSKVRIRNFQSIQKADIELGNFTAIVGESNSGKSAIVRALHAVFRNRSGNDFITSGEKQTAVEVEVDGESVTWGKAKSATYKYRDEVFDKVGVSVPPPIEAKLAAPVLTLADTDIDLNFQRQFDGPFLIAGRSSVPVLVFGTVTGVDALYDGMRSSNKKITNARGKYKTYQALVDEIREELRAYQTLPQTMKFNEGIRRDFDGVLDLYARLDAFEALYQEVSIRDLPDPVDVTSSADGLSVLQAYVGIRRDIRDVLPHEVEVATVRASLERVHALECIRRDIADESLPEISELPEVGALQDLQALRVEIAEAEDALRMIDEDIQESERQMEGVRDMITICPTCGKGTFDV